MGARPLDVHTARFTVRRSQFTLRSMMLLVLWMAATLALGRLVVLLGIAFALATAPALVRTRRLVAQDTARGLMVETPVMAGMFISSLGTTALIAAASLGVAIGVLSAVAVFGL